jgi:hypothetical protein
MIISFLKDETIVHRAGVRFGDEAQERSQLDECLHADIRLFVKLDRGAERFVEHPIWDVEAVAPLVTGHVAAKDQRSRATFLALDQ